MPKKIVTIVGARPQFVKAAMLSFQIKKNEHFKQILIHTGQHYDTNMSDIFFSQLDIGKPDYNLGLGGGSHAKMTGSMLIEIEKILLNESPDYVLVYGDTNSTVAGALAAAKLQLPVIHVEAGLRSFRRSMPEEMNRVVTDHLSDFLFCPTDQAVKNLKAEGICTNSERFVQNSGDIMYDAFLYYSKNHKNSWEMASWISPLHNDKNETIDLLKSGSFVLATIHRDFNVEDPEVLTHILKGLSGSNLPVIMPLHPRTAGCIKKFSLSGEIRENLIFIRPVGYFQMLFLEKSCRKIVTDSGGVQKEAYFAGKPAIIIRPDTEWNELISQGTGLLVPAAFEKIKEALDSFTCKSDLFDAPLFGRGNCAEEILTCLAAR